jgi:cell division protein FtsN
MLQLAPDVVTPQPLVASAAKDNVYKLDAAALNVSSSSNAVTPASTKEIIHETPPSVTPAALPSPGGGAIWYTMAGAFREPANATTLISDLKARGYDAILVDITRSGLYRVAYRSFDNEEAALQQLQSLRSTENPDALILKK